MKKSKHTASNVKSKSFTRNVGLIVAVMGILCYIRTISFDYTLDDFSVIKENRVTTMGISGIKTIFTTPYRFGYTTQGDQLYRPVPKSILAILWSISPNNPVPGHLLNVLLYGLTGFILFFALFRWMGNEIYIPFITSVLFMVHPVHSEVVANIKSMDEIIALLFFLITLLQLHQYILSQNKKWLFSAVVMYFLALLSKESAITFIALAPLTLYFFSKTKSAQIFSITAWMMIPVILFMIIRQSIFSGANSPLPPVADNLLVLASSDWIAQKASAIYFLGYYLKLLVFPHPLAFDYSLNQLTLVQVTDWKFILSAMIYLGLAIFAALTFKKKNLVAYGILFFLLTISLSSNLFRLIGTHFAERLLFTPSLGFCFAIGAILSQYIDRKADLKQKFLTIPTFFRARPILLSIVGVLSLSFFLKTLIQSGVWKNNLSLFEHGVKAAPNSMRTHYYLGNYLIDGDYYKSLPAGQQEKERNRGMQELKKSISIYPYSESYFSLGNVHYLKHEYDSSLYYYNEAIQLAPYIAKYHNNIATVYFEMKQFDKALAECQIAVQYDPYYTDAWNNMASVYGAMNQLDQAMVNFQKTLSIDPNNARANYFIGKILQNSAKPEEQAQAQFYLNKAASLDAQYK